MINAQLSLKVSRVINEIPIVIGKVGDFGITKVALEAMEDYNKVEEGIQCWKIQSGNLLNQF